MSFHLERVGRGGRASAAEYGVTVPTDGVEVPHLLESSNRPRSRGSQRQRIADLTRRAGFEDRLSFSSLLGKPRYV